MTTRKIYCCECEKEVDAYLTTGDKIYPWRPDLADKNFWRCPNHRMYVGCHPGTITPLGSIPTKYVRKLRNEIHQLLDPIWKEGYMKRRDIYDRISKELGKPYHTGDLTELEDIIKVIDVCYQIRKELNFYD